MTAQYGREKAEEWLAVCQDFADDLLASHGDEAVEAFWKKIASRSRRVVRGYREAREAAEREAAKKEYEERTAQLQADNDASRLWWERWAEMMDAMFPTDPPNSASPTATPDT